MQDKAYYIKNLLKTLGISLIGILIGCALTTAEIPIFRDAPLLTAVALAGLPFGWMAMRKVFGHIIFGGLIGALLNFMLMLTGAMAIGWAILLYRLIKDMVQLILVCRTQHRQCPDGFGECA